MTLIGIDCLKQADTNNYFWYRLKTTDTKKTSFFVSYKWWWADTKKTLPTDTINVFSSSVTLQTRNSLCSFIVAVGRTKSNSLINNNKGMEGVQ
jgi:hypothetical protein